VLAFAAERTVKGAFTVAASAYFAHGSAFQ